MDDKIKEAYGKQISEKQLYQILQKFDILYAEMKDMEKKVLRAMQFGCSMKTQPKLCASFAGNRFYHNNEGHPSLGVISRRKIL